MNRGLLIWLLCFLSHSGFSQFTLSQDATISIITLGPSQDELYTAFGHSGIRVYDSAQHIDAFFNYGVFNFNQPHFYLNFAKGNLNYMVEASSYEAYRNYYLSRHRFVHEQVLELTTQQQKKIVDFLLWNIQPQHQNYWYDYFYNNCATKVRDVFKTVLKNEIAFDSSFVRTHYTIRQLTDLYLHQQPWGDLGIDVCLGLPMDKKASPHEYMFLPDYIESSFDHATNTLIGKRLVKKKIMDDSTPKQLPFQWFQPWIVFGIFLAFTLCLTWHDWHRKKLSTWFDLLLFFVSGVLGILLLLLWTATDHKAAANNFNLLWAVPTHAIVALALLRKKKPTWLKIYFLATAILSALLLGFWHFIPQALNVFLMPVVGAMLVRSLVIRFAIDEHR